MEYGNKILNFILESLLSMSDVDKENYLTKEKKEEEEEPLTILKLKKV